MWFDEINKKIQEAENSNQHSDTGDTAWRGMETLLDRHLPVKKKRRRFIFFLLPALLGAGIATLLLVQNGKKNSPQFSKQNTAQSSHLTGKDQQSKPPAADPQLSSENTRNGSLNEKEDQTKKDPDPLLHPPSKLNSRSIVQLRDKAEGQPKRPNYIQQSSTSKVANTRITTKAVETTSSLNKSTNVHNPEQIKDRDEYDSTTKPVSAVIAPVNRPGLTDSNKAGDSLQTKSLTIKKSTSKKTNSFGNNFSLNVSFGPDISGVGIQNPGNVQLQYGVGAGYAMSKNFSIRTGVYAGVKKYTADSADYHAPYTINHLEKIDADCFVLEIPLTLVYHFNPVNKHNWFIAGGASSYVMKKETYDYHYKNYWGQPQYYSHSYKNGNAHLFSVINISGGYRYTISNRLSFMAEPYLKIPVSGVGVGKVKLTSTGILFTAGFKPFVRK